MISVSEAQSIVLSQVHKTGEETVSLAALAGRILAQDVVAQDDHPAFPASTMDGYAIAADDVSPWREVVGVQIAGPDQDLQIFPGQTVKIMTGAPLPRGADAVIPIERVEQADDHIVMPFSPIESGAFVRQIGSDLPAGETVLRQGTRIGPVELGLIATMGYDSVQVAKRPRIAVISTGDELVEPGSTLSPGMIRDSNRFSLAASLIERGADVVFSGRVGDDVGELQRQVEAIRADIDVLVTSGGVSVGDKDIVRMLLGETADVKFRRVFMKPGKPLTFAVDRDLVVFGLPGNPVSSMVSMELFVAPALAAMTGAINMQVPRVPVTFAGDVKQSDRPDFQRAFITVDSDGRLIARTTGNQISSRLASMLGANGLVEIEPGTGVILAGARATAILLGPPLPQ